MSKTIGVTTTQFVYDRLNPVQELNGAAPPAVTANLLMVGQSFQFSLASMSRHGV